MILAILKMIGCLALLMFGMKTMSEGLQKLTGGHLRAVLGTMTKHRLGGLLTGTFVTAAVQSSTATTVIDGDYGHDCKFRKCRLADFGASDSCDYGRKYRYHGDGVDNVHIWIPVQYEQLRVACFRTWHRTFVHAQK